MIGTQASKYWSWSDETLLVDTDRRSWYNYPERPGDSLTRDSVLDTLTRHSVPGLLKNFKISGGNK